MFEVLILAGVFLYLVVLHVSTALYWLEVWDRGKKRLSNR